MHRILLREAVIDVPTHHLEATTSFWAGALLAEPRTVESHREFQSLTGAASLAHVGLQDIGDGAARVHLDIETDDIEAEVDRLLRLGASEVARHAEWTVLRDPAGLLFCVVPPESPSFAERAREVD